MPRTLSRYFPKDFTSPAFSSPWRVWTTAAQRLRVGQWRDAADFILIMALESEMRGLEGRMMTSSR